MTFGEQANQEALQHSLLPDNNIRGGGGELFNENTFGLHQTGEGFYIHGFLHVVMADWFAKRPKKRRIEDIIGSVGQQDEKFEPLERLVWAATHYHSHENHPPS